MPNLVCLVPVCPLRAEPSHRSEQVSQLLFGDMVEIVENAKDFTKVRCLYDDYEGWCQRSQLEEINILSPQELPEQLSADYINEVLLNETMMYVPMGSAIGKFAGEGLAIGNSRVRYNGKLATIPPAGQTADVVREIAMSYLNTAYQWGGRSVFGVDCSGFTQMVFRFAGIPLLRDAWQQASQGEAIGFLQEVHCGDLAFFDNEEQRIIHVGILLSPTEIIHASGKVRIDHIDHQGIVHTETGLRTHKLRVIKRLFS